MIHKYAMSTCTLDNACLLGNKSIYIATDNTYTLIL